MKYRNKQLTRIQRNLRKFHSSCQSICSMTGERLKKKKPRWRQICKARAKRYASWKKRHESQEIMKLDF